mgnify:CR=1 FL=1
MKILSKLMLALVLVLGYSTTNAQDENNPWAIEVGVNAVDLFPIGYADGQTDSNESRGELFEEFAKKHDDEKVIDILQKTWRKMSKEGHAEALKLKFSDKSLSLVKRAIT